jgi:hypothetical protein
MAVKSLRFVVRAPLPRPTAVNLLHGEPTSRRPRRGLQKISNLGIFWYFYTFQGVFWYFYAAHRGCNIFFLRV